MTKKTEKIIKSIDPKKDYSLSEVVKEGLMGELKTYFVCKNIILDELWAPLKERVLKAEKRYHSVGTIYYIKGANLINYLKING